jgi:hypothetical protein
VREVPDSRKFVVDEEDETTADELPLPPPKQPEMKRGISPNKNRILKFIQNPIRRIIRNSINV